MRAMLSRSTLAFCLSLCCAAGASHVPGVGGRQLDRFSPVVRTINDRPVPEDLEGVRVAAFLLDLAHDPGATGLYRYAERQALLGLLREPHPPKPATVELAASSMHGEEKNLAALRARVLQSPVRADVLRELDPSLEPGSHGEAFRHEAASMWVQDHGGRWRRLGVRVVNATPGPLHSGEFDMTFRTDRDSMAFRCHYQQLAAGDSRAILCSGSGTRPAEPVLRAIRGEGGATVEHRKVAFGQPGGRVEVSREATQFIDDDAFVSRRAIAMLDESSCRERRTCGVQAKDEVMARPMLMGTLLGLVAGSIYALVLLARGRRSAQRAAAALSVTLFLVLTAGVVALVATIWQGPGLLVALLAGFALGQVGDLMIGFCAALAGCVAVLEFARGRRRLR